MTDFVIGGPEILIENFFFISLQHKGNQTESLGL